MDRGMDRVWVWVCDPSLMFLAVAKSINTNIIKQSINQVSSNE